MNQKSKFTTFILSFIPGLSHLYLGLSLRSLIFFALFFGCIIAVVGLAALFGTSQFLAILLIALPVIWFIALVDALTLIDNIYRLDSDNADMTGQNRESIFANNPKLITMALSMIPGAGHMYLGYMNLGLQLMAIFLFTIFFMAWLNMSLFIFLLPLIWFYSLFDAFHRSEAGFNSEPNISLLSWFDRYPRIIGWLLIAVGILVCLERFLSPLIAWEIRNYLQTGIVALILIAGGIKLLTGSKAPDQKGAEVCDSEE